MLSNTHLFQLPLGMLGVLSVQELHKSFVLSRRSIVVSDSVSFEQNQRRIPVNGNSTADSRVVVAVHYRNVGVVGVDAGELHPLWQRVFAVAAPRRIEHDEPVGVKSEISLELRRDLGDLTECGVFELNELLGAYQRDEENERNDSIHLIINITPDDQHQDTVDNNFMESNKERLFVAGTHNATFKVEGREDCQGYYVNKSNSQYGLVLIQEWWGLNQSIVITADRIAENGYQIIAPDIYRGKVAKDTEQAGHLLSGLDWAGALKDIAGAQQFLIQNGAKKVGILGFCMGGALTIASAATIPGFDAAAPFYGIPDLSKIDVSKITCKFEAHFGQKDDHKGFSDPESAQKLIEKIKQTNPTANLIIYKDAGHAFMNQDSPNYNVEAYNSAIERLKAFFTL